MDEKERFEIIKKAQEELDEIIKKDPEKQKYQDYINEQLNKVGKNQHNRLAILENLIYENKIQLKEASEDLDRYLTKKLKE